MDKEGRERRERWTGGRTKEGRRREGGVSRKAGASREGGLSRRQERMSPQGNRAGPRT